MMGQKGLLRALPASQLVSARTLPQNLLNHLLVSLPPGMPVQAAALLQKVERLVGKEIRYCCSLFDWRASVNTSKMQKWESLDTNLHNIITRNNSNILTYKILIQLVLSVI
jgi:hypothetical protein